MENLFLQARQKQQLSLDQVRQHTNMSDWELQALEEWNQQAFPSVEAFFLAFKKYAEYLHLSVQESVQKYFLDHRRVYFDYQIHPDNESHPARSMGQEAHKTLGSSSDDLPKAPIQEKGKQNPNKQSQEKQNREQHRQGKQSDFFQKKPDQQKKIHSSDSKVPFFKNSSFYLKASLAMLVLVALIGALFLVEALKTKSSDHQKSKPSATQSVLKDLHQGSQAKESLKHSDASKQSHSINSASSPSNRSTKDTNTAGKQNPTEQHLQKSLPPSEKHKAAIKSVPQHSRQSMPQSNKGLQKSSSTPLEKQQRKILKHEHKKITDTQSQSKSSPLNKTTLKHSSSSHKSKLSPGKKTSEKKALPKKNKVLHTYALVNAQARQPINFTIGFSGPTQMRVSSQGHSKTYQYAKGAKISIYLGNQTQLWFSSMKYVQLYFKNIPLSIGQTGHQFQFTWEKLSPDRAYAYQLQAKEVQLENGN